MTTTTTRVLRSSLILAAPLLAALGTGCADKASTPLAELKANYGATTLEMTSLGQINVLLKTASTEDCAQIGDDVVAKFDGVPMSVSTGGKAETASGCYPVAFWISEMPLDQATAYEASSNGSALTISDSSTTWTVTSTKMFSNNFVIDEAGGSITWQDVSNISTAQTLPGTDLTITNNVINFAPGAEVDQVTAYAHPTPTLCDGVDQCTVDLLGSRVYKSTMPGL